MSKNELILKHAGTLSLIGMFSWTVLMGDLIAQWIGITYKTAPAMMVLVALIGMVLAVIVALIIFHAYDEIKIATESD